MTQASFLISTRTAEPQGGNAPTNPSRNQARILSLPQFFIYPPRQPETSFRLVVLSSGFILNNLNTCAQRAASPCFPFTNGRHVVVGCLCSSSSRVRRRVTGADCPVAVDRRGYFTRVPHPIQTCTPPPHLLFLCSRLTPKGARVSRSYTTGEDGDGFWAPSQVGVFPPPSKAKRGRRRRRKRNGKRNRKRGCAYGTKIPGENTPVALVVVVSRGQYFNRVISQDFLGCRDCAFRRISRFFRFFLNLLSVSL